MSIMAASTLSNDTFYFKIPTIIMDLILHCSIFEIVLNIMSPTMAEAETFDIDIFFGFPALVLLAVSYAISVRAFPIKLHQREVSIPIVGLRAVIRTFLTAIVFTILVALIYKVVPRRFFLFDFTVAAVVLAVFHMIFSFIIRMMRKMGRNTIGVVMVGADENAVKLYEEMSIGMGVNGYRVQGFFTSLYPENIPSGVPNLGKISSVPDYLLTHKVDQVFCSLSPQTEAEDVNEIIRICENKFIKFFYVPNMDGYINRKMRWSEFGSVTIIHPEEADANSKLKSLLDDIL